MRQLAQVDLIQARDRRVLLPWRLAFIAFALALATGTHWPKLELGPEVPATDKTIHLIAFGGATILLYLTRWVRSIWLSGVVVFLWSLVDEFSQGIPGLGRTAHWHDMLANLMGITVACAWLWAMKPVGVQHRDAESRKLVAGPNCVRLRSLGFVFEEMFADWRAWAASVVGAIAGGLPVIFAMIALETDVARMANIIGIAVAAGLTLVMWSLLWHRKLKQCLQLRPCVTCGAATTDDNRRADDPSVRNGIDQALRSKASVEAQDHVALTPALSQREREKCGSCGAPVDAGQWLQVHAPSPRVLFRYSGRAAFVAVAALILGFGLVFLSPVLYSILLDQGPTSGGARVASRAVHSIGRLPQELVNTIDLAVYLLLFAVVARVYRGQLARFYDRAVRCLRCGHDLRGTPSVRGVGTCGECGAAFVRAQSGLEPRMNTDEHG